MVNVVKTRLNFKNKGEALKFHLLAISTEGGLKLSPSDIAVVVEIYLFGYNKEVLFGCVLKNYFKSEQAVRNSVAKLTKMGILQKSRNDRWVNPLYLPHIDGKDIIFSYDVTYDEFMKKG